MLKGEAALTNGEKLTEEETLKYLKEKREILEVDLDRYLAMDLNDLADLVSRQIKAIDEKIASGTV